MKGLFPEFRDASQVDHQGVWRSALFVIDTNVLLNLYRYRSSTRDELLGVLEQLSGRIWIPHHVALEFHRNRLGVIADQNRRFSEVRRIVESARELLNSELDKLQLQRRHALIDPKPLTDGFTELVKTFLDGLKDLQGSQQSLTGPDLLLSRIEELFDGKVGGAPASQAELDESFKAAENRYTLSIPPGFRDSKKTSSQSAGAYMHAGLVYKSKYGDYLVWQQLLSHARSAAATSVVFTTDDSKDDWWQRIESEGPKTIGPRTELIDEAKRVGSIDQFLMYSPEMFLKYAKEFLPSPVSEETLSEVRDLSSWTWMRQRDMRARQELAIKAERAVFEWLQANVVGIRVNEGGFPDFVATSNTGFIGFEVHLVITPRSAASRIRRAVDRAVRAIIERRFTEFTIILVVKSPVDGDELKQLLLQELSTDASSQLRFLIGVVAEQESGEPCFVVTRELLSG